MSPITKEFTKEQLQQIIETDHVQCGEASALARIALASLEAEESGRNPVLAYADSYRDMAKQGVESIPVWSVITDLERNIAPLYSAPPAPVVPDEMLCEFYEVDSWPDLIRELVKHVEQLQDSARRNVKPWEDTFPETLLPAYIERVKQADDACRAAMFQGADRPQNEPQNIPENIPATQFKPVADLYGLTSPTGDETSFTFDAVEARDFIDGGWSCQEYVELERFQEAVSGNSPVIQDGWVACSERMPSAGEQVLAYRPDAPESNDPLIKMATYVGGSAHGHGFDCYCKPTHWMPLPAAPQQEA